ncbi:hypothetical protein CcaCcLH18_13650 [Colletotrichum camelliae]|nr:hypothetical protein CcaCcLH18_13650 [Colletotrichum camelliae]
MADNNNLRKVLLPPSISPRVIKHHWGYTEQVSERVHRERIPDEAVQRHRWYFVQIRNTSHFGHYVEGVNDREFGVILQRFQNHQMIQVDVVHLCHRGHEHIFGNVDTLVPMDPPSQPPVVASQQMAMPQNLHPDMNTPVPQPSGTVPQQVPIPQNPYANMSTPNPQVSGAVPQQVPMPQSPHANMGTPNHLALGTGSNQMPAPQHNQSHGMRRARGSSPHIYHPLDPLFPGLGDPDSNQPPNEFNFGPT